MSNRYDRLKVIVEAIQQFPGALSRNNLHTKVREAIPGKSYSVHTLAGDLVSLRLDYGAPLSSGNQHSGFTLIKNFDLEAAAIARNILQVNRLKGRTLSSGTSPERIYNDLLSKHATLTDWILNNTTHPDFLDKVTERNSVSVQLEVSRQQRSIELKKKQLQHR